jgi:hypothetical protein
MSNIFGNIENLLTSFQAKITEIQILMNRSIKIATAIIVACFVIYVIREYLNWRMQVKLQKQNGELLKKMTRIITLLEENLKIK